MGTYVATLDVGDYDNAPFAQLGNIGMTAGGVSLTPTDSSTPTPSSGAWETWNLTYTVTAADPNLGSAIGFSITVPQLTYYDNRNVAFDNLEISFIPGP